jgi:hypothetical protein
MRTRRTLLAVMLAMPWSLAIACGVCIEDKIAVTYDHAVVSQSTARHQVVVFTAVEGPAAAKALVQKARSAAGRARGVARASVRAAVDPPALSFALDPAEQSPEAAIGEIERTAGTPGLRLTLLRVLR